MMTRLRVWLPREHGAYGQVAFPLAAAFLVAGVSAPGLLLSVAVVVGFLAHEPAAIVLGQRGPRARRELAAPAVRWLTCCAAIGAAAAGGAALALDGGVRWSLAVPAGPALLLAAAMVRDREKSWYGETAAAFAFAGVPVPILLAARTPLDVAFAVAIPFVLLFTTTTLAVRVVILRVRGGGDPRATAATRRATLAICAASAALIATLANGGWLPWWVMMAAAPGLIVAAVLVNRPPSPARLRSLGWTLVAVSTLTTAAIVLAA
jgi:hypothetical protein